MRNFEQDTRAGQRSTVMPGAEESEAGPKQASKKPALKHSLIVFIKIPAIAGGILWLTWFLDTTVSGR